MAFQYLSVGDILMLSQQAWKIGRAFTQGRNGAIAEFKEIESEANDLSEALKLTAETLHSDGSILSQAEPETRGAVNEILESAGRTLGDLESFVEKYQVIRKRNTNGGFVVERSWSELILAHYKTVKWTTEGGDITALRNLLHAHINTINLTMQALQSRSLARLERTVMPMADNITSIHNRVNGDLGDKIDDLHRLIMSVANHTPSLVARDRAIEGNIENEVGRRSTISTLDYENEDTQQRRLEAPPILLASLTSTDQQSIKPHDSVLTATDTAHGSRRSSGTRKVLIEPQYPNTKQVRTRGSPASPRDNSRPSSTRTGSLESATGAFASPQRQSSPSRRESTTLPALFGTISINENAAESAPYGTSPTDRALLQGDSPSPNLRSRSNLHRSFTDRHILPPPGIPLEEEPDIPATPSSFFNPGPRSRSESYEILARSAQTSSPQRDSSSPVRSPPSPLSTLPAFEKLLFRNAAILCDVRAKLLEYARKVPDEPDPRYDTEMVEACQECRVCVIRKREHRAHGSTRLATSIWTISIDGVVRCKQSLSESVETVPYCSYFEEEKVSITPSEFGEMSLDFYGEKWTDELESRIRTNWVNYRFESENDAVAFQSAVFGRMLMGSFQTTKTTVIHDGIMGTFAFEEQFANIEMLRLWEDDGIATPGATGGVLALMHISSNFGEGWARWWMNCSKQQVRLRKDGAKQVKLKGINIVVVKPGSLSKASEDKGQLQRIETRESTTGAKSPAKKTPVKRVTGINIEFKRTEDRDRFIEVTKEIQEHMIPLPDL